MKTLLLSIFTLLATGLFAQSTVTWKGGTPGKELNWNEAKNWSNNKVPNEFSNVIIPDVSTTTFSNPVITEGTIELNSLAIESNAKLIIESKAKVVIYGYTEGLLYENITAKGVILTMDEPLPGSTAFEIVDVNH